MGLLFEIIGFLSDLMGLSFRDEFPRLRARRALRRAVRRAVNTVAATAGSQRGDLASHLKVALAGLREDDFVDPYGNLLLRDSLARRLGELERIAPQPSATKVARALHEAILEEIGRQGYSGSTLEHLNTRVQDVRRAHIEAAAHNSEVDFSGTVFGLPVSDEPVLGREGDIAELLDHCRMAAGATIVWIHGAAGSGKTTLAAELARRLDDGAGLAVPFVRLRGASKELDGTTTVTDPQRILADLLRRYDVAGADRLSESEMRARWKTVVGLRNVQVIVLDDARDADQIEPFLPGDGHCVLIVTSRANPPGLLARRLAIPSVSIDAIAAHATALDGRDAALVSRLAREISQTPLLLPLLRSLSSDPDQLLGGLPPEILGADPAADDLVDIAHRLVIDGLTPELHRSLCLLAGQPGFRLTAATLAALDQLESGEAAARLAALAEVGLLKPGPEDSYGFHDRTVAFVSADLSAYVGETELRGARLRLLVHQLAHMRAVHDRFDDSQGRNLHPDSDRLHLTADEAQHWLTTERRNLREALRFHSDSQDVTTLRVLMELCGLAGVPLLRLGYTRDAELALSSAVDIAVALGDRPAEAESRRALGGRVFRMLDRYAEAERELGKALDLFEELDDLEGQANTRCGLGHVARLDENWDVATDQLKRARKGYIELGLDRGEADCLLGLAEVGMLRDDPDLEESFALYRLAGRLFQDHSDMHGVAESCWGRGEIARMRGDLADASRDYESALELARLTHDQLVEGETRRGMGYLALAEGRPADALRHFGAATELHRRIMDPVGTADALAGQGETLLLLGRTAEAGDPLKEARKLYSGIGHSHAARMRQLLLDNGLAEPGEAKARWRRRDRKDEYTYD
ncbi:tetratricopeptide repeat protein [Glycomyces buryatensis]|uniref:tetratricopeptide repeat protein n=1 Tax=Glycomyces buryatensis TaxID=2570927 RepID=UPI0014562B03|nr:tetratricopeptide repeat protein [Glycomyces buryatensis]